MKQLKLFGLPIAAISLLVWCLSFVSPVYGSTPTEAVVLTQAQYNTLLKNFDTLENTIDSQLNTINELEQQLSIAKMSTNESQQALLEALRQLEEQRQLLIEAQNSLREQESLLLQQRLSLEKAEIYLNQQKEIIKKAQHQNRNSKILNIILGTALVYAITR
nr:MAG TPA: hypothetical protein [Caudoviricetes sp.]